MVGMISKQQKAADFTEVSREINSEYLENITSKSPEYLLDIMAQIVEVLLLKINVPRKEAEEFSGKVKEWHMGELFANFEAYDVQETRRLAREEVREEDIEKMVKTLKNLGISKEIGVTQIKENFNLSEEEVMEVINSCW